MWHNYINKCILTCILTNDPFSTRTDDTDPHKQAYWPLLHQDRWHRPSQAYHSEYRTTPHCHPHHDKQWSLTPWSWPCSEHLWGCDDAISVPVQDCSMHTITHAGTWMQHAHICTGAGLQHACIRIPVHACLHAWLSHNHEHMINARSPLQNLKTLLSIKRSEVTRDRAKWALPSICMCWDVSLENHW